MFDVTADCVYDDGICLIKMEGNTNASEMSSRSTVCQLLCLHLIGYASRLA